MLLPIRAQFNLCMKKKTVLFLLCLFFAISTYSQNAMEMLKVISPSPTVEGLCRYGEIPVSYATGIPEISIPLYTLKCGSLELPITLSYHAGGIRVDDAASWVGLGWSLNAGGVIGATTVGRNDRFQKPEYDIPTYEEIKNGYFDGYSRFVLEDMELYQSNEIQPDILSYNFLHYSGQFIYDASENKFYDVNGSKKTVFKKVGIGSPAPFSACDEKGNSYLFDKIEMTSIRGINYTYQTTLYSAWNLSKVVDAGNNDSILFNYGNTTHFEIADNRKVSSRTFGLNKKEEWYSGIAMMNPHMGISLGNHKPVFNTSVRYQTYKVQSIKASNGLKIILESDSLREDMQSYSNNNHTSGIKLNTLSIFDMNNKRIKRWEFIYDYFRSYISDPSDNTLGKRLKLIALKEYGSDESDVMIYRFSYYGEEVGEPEMPYRYSFSGKDAWGFCNGRPTLSMAKDSLRAYPNFSGLYFNMYCKEYREVLYNKELMVSNTSGESKEASGNYTHAYSLKKITYPTGGYNQFIYEPNHYSTIDDFMGKYEFTGQASGYGPGMRIKEIISSTNGIDKFCRTFSYSEGEILNVPRFIKRKVYQGSTSIFADEDEYYSPKTQSYLEMYGEPYNSINISNGGCIGYRSVTEQYSEGKNEYTYTTLEKDIDDDESIGSEKFANYQNFLIYNNPGIPDQVVLFVHGKNIYHFGNQSIVQNISDRYSDFMGYCGTFFNRNLLLNKKVYDSSNRLIQNEDNEYENKGVHPITGIELKRSPGLYRGDRPTYFYSFYWNIVGLSRLVNQTTTQYYHDKVESAPKIISTKIHYSYNANNLLSDTRLINSNGDTIITLIRYPSEISSSSTYMNMVQKNMLNYPIETIKIKNGNVSTAELTHYARFGNAYYPAEFYSYTPTMPNSNFTNFNGTVQSLYGFPQAIIHNYEHGRIASFTKKDNMTCNYIWAYNWEYPIAEIKGISYAQLLNSISPNTYGKLTLVTESQLNEIRFKFAAAEILTFMYKPFIGMEIKQLPNRTLYKYGYDTFGRLNSISQGTSFSDTKLIEQYKYHVTNE